MGKIHIKNGVYTLVDDEFLEDLQQHKWYINYGYVVRTEYLGGGRKNKKTRQVFMHREIMKPMKGFVVDHINGDKLDNRLSNLRVCTHQQNIWNKKKQNNTKTRFKGVTFRKDMKKWRAKIFKDGKEINLGTYESELDAAIAYNLGARKYFGEFANLNNV